MRTLLLKVIGRIAFTGRWFAPAFVSGLGVLPAAAIALVLLVAPGLWLAVIAARRGRLDLAEMAAVSFAGTVSIAGIVGEVAHFAGLPLDVVIGALVAGIAASAVCVALLATRRWVAPIHDGGGVGLAIAAVAGVVTATTGPWLAYHGDAFYHLAAIRTLALTNKPLVTDPFLGTMSRVVDPTSGSWHTLLAAFVRPLGGEPLLYYNALAAAAVAMFALLVWAVVRRAVRGRWAPALATVLVFVGIYALDPRMIDQPNAISLPLAFLAMALAAQTLTAKDHGLLLAAGLAGVATVTMHLGTAETYFIGLAVVFVWGAVAAFVGRRSDDEGRVTWAGLGRFAGVGAAVALVAAPVILSRVSGLSGPVALDASLAGTGIGSLIAGLPTALLPLTHIRFVTPDAALGRPWWVYLPWLGIVACAAVVALRDRDRRALLVAALASIPLLTLANPLVSSVVLARFPYQILRLRATMVLSLFVAIAWGLSFVRARDWRLTAGVLAIVAALGVVVAAAPTIGLRYATTDPYSVYEGRIHDVRVLWGPGLEATMQRVAGRSMPVVVGDPTTIYMVAGVSSARVPVVPMTHSPFWFEAAHGPATRADMATLLAPLSTATERRAIVVRYHAAFVALDLANKPEAAALATFTADGYTQAARSGTLVLLRAP
jgi:hypothetical protein